MPRLGSDSRLEPDDRHTIDRVDRHGWQVSVVGSGRCECCGDDATRDDGPAFAYTVGLSHRAGLNHIGLVSAWFHRRPVDALQIVWPTVSGVFAWQPGLIARRRHLPEVDPEALRRDLDDVLDATL